MATCNLNVNDNCGNAATAICCSTSKCSAPSASLNMLPDEILEFIFTYLPPYGDLEHCSLVCKRWQLIVKSKYLKTY